MSTQSQNEANLANAQHSTGPRTELGKAASSLNALKHGLTAKTVLLPGEDPAEFQQHSDKMLLALHPLDAVQEALAQEIIDVQWRLLRVSNLEARILSDETPDMKAFASIGLHASRLKRQYSTSLKELLHLKDRFNKDFDEEIEKAALIHHADLVFKRPPSVADFGFDFTIPKIELYIEERQALKIARHELSIRGLNWAA